MAHRGDVCLTPLSHRHDDVDLIRVDADDSILVGNDECDRIYTVVDAKPKRTTALRRLANVAENPSVALLADHYEEDWAALWWVRAEGRGRVTEADAPEARRAVELLRARYPQQVAVGAVLAVDVERWSGWAARSPARSIRARGS